MWCTIGRIRESMIHGRNAMNKWMVTRTTAIKDIRLERKKRIVTPTSSAQRKSTMKYMQDRVDKWTSKEFNNIYPVHYHYGVVVIMRSYMYVTCNMSEASL